MGCCYKDMSVLQLKWNMVGRLMLHGCGSSPANEEVAGCAGNHGL